MKQKTILVITDGIGFNKNDEFNAFANAKKPNYDWLFAHSAHSLLKTSGIAVGLPEGQMGNSEVGHMTIGAGRVLYQNLVKINMAIDNGNLRKNSDLIRLAKCKNIHIIGLYSDGGVHSHLRHFDELAQIFSDFGCNIFLHPITDGRDVLPTSGAEFLRELESKILAMENTQIATICGRFYAMDRDNRWDRVQIAYENLIFGVNGGKICESLPSEYLKKSYENGKTDEFIEPVSFGKFDGISQDDGVLIINFRNDRVREISAALGCAEFSYFARPFVVKNLLTMTSYDDKFSFPVLFAPENIENSLSEVIANAGLRQLHAAETEKYAHVTFFFNGGKEELVSNETRILVPSPKVKTYDEKPEMSACEVCENVIKGIENGFDFIVVNFANGDMVGHTGNFEAAIKAVECVDKCIGEILSAVKTHNYAYVQISDHGNCEDMRGKNGEILTNHTIYDVPCFVLAENVCKISDGSLANVAPTILKIMGLEIPPQMENPLV